MPLWLLFPVLVVPVSPLSDILVHCTPHPMIVSLQLPENVRETRATLTAYSGSWGAGAAVVEVTFEMGPGRPIFRRWSKPGLLLEGSSSAYTDEMHATMATTRAIDWLKICREFATVNTFRSLHKNKFLYVTVTQQ